MRDSREPVRERAKKRLKQICLLITVDHNHKPINNWRGEEALPFLLFWKGKQSAHESEIVTRNELVLQKLHFLSDSKAKQAYCVCIYV